uniref:Cytochrome c oxidase subunit 3 n=1 Tax=Tenebrionoidea sp. 24 KM-2017 TaxID=2219480 RepID=A0A346RJF8_9CUCU|nr:cytochrome c oxidase subunit 3 [Tenebrionoidea sp. 24 KM-2017]
MSNQNHPFHLVNVSPWPILASFSTLTLMLGIIKWFHLLNNNLMLISMFTLIIISYQWWRDITREGTFQGYHSMKVSIGLKWGMILFITSEIFFFLSFFWSFFHNSLSPSIEIGLIWPPLNITPFNPLQIPLLNTLILISSGLTVTWAHHALMENNYTQSLQGLFFTVILGLYFTALQAYEYLESSFSISDSSYGSSFFMATGFHGIHVIIGSSFLLICLIRHMQNHFSMIHHFGFEAAAWYWHFVDVVWLFLYISIYWWGS